MILLKSINVRLKFLKKFYLAKLEKTLHVIKRATVIRRHLVLKAHLYTLGNKHVILCSIIGLLSKRCFPSNYLPILLL